MFDGLTKKQRNVLGLIAVGTDGGHNPRTLQALLDRGLIRAYAGERRDRLGTFKVLRYCLPVPVHIAWCQWCTDHADDDEEEVRN